MRARLTILATATLLVLGGLVGQARAVTLGFDCITNGLASNCSIGESQIAVELTDQGGGVVRFLFSNSGPESSSISEIYFDDGALLAISSVFDGPGTNFEPDANPPSLPGGNLASPPFVASEGFLAQSIPSPVTNGAGVGEWVAIDFALQGGQTILDVESQLASGQLRVGIHVIGFLSGGSESFVNNPVPEPGTALLVGVGLAGLALRRQRRR